MSDEPTAPDPTHDARTPGPDEVDYPTTLRITSIPQVEAHSGTIERAARWEEGADVPHVVNFEEPSRLRELLTTRRLELLETVMADPPGSIRDLAVRLDRDVHEVHDDLYLLADYGIIHFTESGRAKRPYVPYDTVRIEVEIGHPPDESPPVSA